MLQKLIDEIEKKIAVEDYAIADNAYRECITLITKAFPDFEEAIKKAWLAGSAPNHMTQEQVNRILAEFEGWKFDGIQYLTSEDMKVMIDSCPQYTTDWNDFHRVFRKYVVSGGFLMKFHELLLLETPLQAATRLSQIITDAAIH